MGSRWLAFARAFIAALSGLLLVPATAAASRYEKLAQFSLDGQPNAPLVRGPDGKLYGTATFGGGFGFGSVFSIDPAAASPAITIVYAFRGGGDGAYPRAGLVLAGDGNLYGTTSAGGAGSGTAFRIFPSGVRQLLTWFNPVTGSPDTPLVEGTDGNLYGVASGSSGAAAVYRLTRTGGLSPILSIGAGSTVAPLVRGPDGNFYTTLVSPTSGFWSLLRIANTGAATVLFSSSNAAAHGLYPQGPLVLADGAFYGTTQRGGANLAGIVFRIFPSGGFALLASLPAVSPLPSPGSPSAFGLVRTSDGNFYGTTLVGGPFGSIFRMTPEGVLSTVATFDGTNGAAPRAPLLAMPDGTLWGTTSGVSSTASGNGTVFKLTPGASPLVSTVAAFGAAATFVTPERIVSAADGTLYGITSRNAADGFGGFFRMTTSAEFTTLSLVPDSTGFDTTGLMQAADGSFYGTMAQGGPGSGGTVFRVTPVGIGATIATVASFTVSDPVDGSSPRGGVLQASDGNLYGTTSTGGANGFGTVFRITPGPTPALTTILSFDGANGANPSGALVEGDDGNIYGTTELGGAGNRGTVFSITTAGTLSTVVSFDGTNGQSPTTGLLKASDGSFYGSTPEVGVTTARLFRLTPAGVLTSFNTGLSSTATLVEGPDGSLYGTGPAGPGPSVFRTTKDGFFTMVRLLAPADGADVRSLAVGSDGRLYGAARTGGEGGGGVIFRISNAPPVARDLGSPASPILAVTATAPLIAQLQVSDPDDPDGSGSFVFRLVSQGSKGVAAVGGLGTFEYTPNPGTSGPDSVVFSVTDPMGASSTATVYLTIREVDLPPTISPIADITVDESQAALILPVPFAVDDPDDPPSAWTVRSSFIGSGAFIGSTSLSGTGTSRQLIIAVAPELFGFADFTITFQSKPGSVAVRTFRLTVRQVKRPPMFVPEPADQGAVPRKIVQFAINAKGEPKPTVQWQVSVDGGATWTSAAPFNIVTFKFAAAVSDDGKLFRVVASNSEGSLISRAARLTIRHPQADDLDGDGLSDLIVWRGPTGTWFWLTSSTAGDPDQSGFASRVFGNEAQGDIPLTGDFNGDGVAEPLVWRPSTGTFFVQLTLSFQLGAAGDVPFLGDVDGDGKSDLIVWRPSTGTWMWKTNPSGAPNLVSSVQWGNAALGDRPLIGDFDGDGKTDFAVWRASNGTFYWLTSSTGYTYETARGVQWGSAAHGDTPLLGDFDGDGKTDVAVWRASTGTWFWLPSSKGYAYAAQKQVQWGDASLGDIPIVKEIDGDGIDDLVVWRASTGTWYWLTSSTGYQYVNAGARQWGSAAAGDSLPRR